MELKSKLLIIAAVIAIFASVGGAYHHFVIEREYALEFEAACDPLLESCFAYTCPDDSDSTCESYDYKLIIKNAAEVEALCGTDITGCELTEVCKPDDKTCEVIYCNSESATEDMPCSIVADEDSETEEVVEDSSENP